MSYSSFFFPPIFFSILPSMLVAPMVIVLYVAAGQASDSLIQRLWHSREFYISLTDFLEAVSPSRSADQV